MLYWSQFWETICLGFCQCQAFAKETGWTTVAHAHLLAVQCAYCTPSQTPPPWKSSAFTSIVVQFILAQCHIMLKPGELSRHTCRHGGISKGPTTWYMIPNTEKPKAWITLFLDTLCALTTPAAWSSLPHEICHGSGGTKEMRKEYHIASVGPVYCFWGKQSILHEIS